MALLHALSQAVSGTQTIIHALIIDHNIRDDSADEAQRVSAVVTGWPNVETVIIKRENDFDPRARVMEQARQDRYRILTDYCQKHGVTYLFTGHHGDDQAETFLFRLAKGSGLDGLACMQDISHLSETIKLCRPFLQLSKNTLLEYCADHDITYVSDPSNANTDFMRPRLRESREALEKEGLTSARLTKTALRLSQAKQALCFYSDRLFEQACVEQSDGFYAFELAVLKEHPFEIKKRLIQKTIEMVGVQKSEYGPRMDKLENLTANIFDQSDFKGATLGGAKFSITSKGTILNIEKEQNDA